MPTKKQIEEAMQDEQAGQMLLQQVQAGDTVYIRHEGKPLKGRAMMRSAAGGWILNGGGPYGTPMLADATNIYKMVRPKPKASPVSVKPK